MFIYDDLKGFPTHPYNSVDAYISCCKNKTRHSLCENTTLTLVYKAQL